MQTLSSILFFVWRAAETLYDPRRQSLDSLKMNTEERPLLNTIFSHHIACETDTVRLLTHVLYKPAHFFFHSFITTISYSLQVLVVLWKTGLINTMYGVPPQGHHQGQTRDNSNTYFFTLKGNTYTCVLIKYLSDIYVVSYLVWRSLLCSIIFHPHMECICRWKFIKNKKREKWNMPITKINHV